MRKGHNKTHTFLEYLYEFDFDAEVLVRLAGL